MPFCVYVLTPVHAPHRFAKTYVGFTTNPMRRLRQHNREIAGGARRTGKLGPWEFAAIVSGLPSKICALQLEWALQHPKRGVKTRADVQVLAGRRGSGCQGTLKRKMHELRVILSQCEPWKDLVDLVVRFQSQQVMDFGSEFCSFPPGVRTVVGDMAVTVRARKRRINGELLVVYDDEVDTIDLVSSEDDSSTLYHSAAMTEDDDDDELTTTTSNNENADEDIINLLTPLALSGRKKTIDDNDDDDELLLRIRVPWAA
jgi:predicted GIY-YIG superfamily endonuclease